MADIESTKTSKSTKETTHPKYIKMISTAIETLKERRRYSRVAIPRFMRNRYNIGDNPNSVNSNVKVTLKRGVESGSLIQVKGIGAFGSFKLTKKAAEKMKRVVKSQVDNSFSISQRE